MNAFGISTDDEHTVITTNYSGDIDPEWLTAEVRTGEVYVTFDPIKMVNFIVSALDEERQWMQENASSHFKDHEALKQELGLS
jgi:hypothetical protein